MVKFTTKQYESLIQDLHLIKTQAANELQLAERSIIAVQDSLKLLKAFILAHTFKDKGEEIKFFKEVKPLFLSELIYHTEIYEIEAHKPVGANETIRAYYAAKIERLNLFFTRTQMLYNYYRSNKSNYDELFYLRDTTNEFCLMENAVEIDNRFCTPYSYKLSKLQAFEMVNDYLQKAIHKLDNPATFIDENNQRKFSNLWTDSKVALIELAYALQARGAINNGKGDIKQIITDLEIIFNVEVGNFYRTFQNMRIRKKNTTPFLDGLKESLERKMGEDYFE